VCHRAHYYILQLLFLLLLFSLPILSGRRLDVYHTSPTWCGFSANLERRSEMCRTRLAENTCTQKFVKICHLRTIAQICRAVSSQRRHVSTIEKNLLHSNIFPACLHNTVNFDPLTAEIGWRVWGTPANFNGLRVLASLLHQRRSQHNVLN